MKSQSSNRFGLHFGCRVEEIMKRKNLHYYRVFREENGLSRRIYFRLFKEDYNPTLQTICTIAAALGVHPKELLDFDITKKIVRPKEEVDPNLLAWEAKFGKFK